MKLWYKAEFERLRFEVDEKDEKLQESLQRMKTIQEELRESQSKWMDDQATLSKTQEVHVPKHILHGTETASLETL